MGSTMSEKPGRNDLCHCGSGKKFKICHGRSSDRSYQLWIVVGVLSLAAIWFFTSGSEPTVTPLSSSSNSFSPQASNRTIPTGNPPPGKVWSSEHGHWHDSPSVPATPGSGLNLKEPKLRPLGGLPPEKTQSSQ